MDTNDTRVVFITKYALTQGILTHKVRLGSQEDLWANNPYVYSVELFNQQFKLGTNAFFTEKEAVSASEKLRKKKLESLAKQIKKIRNLQFTVQQ